MVTGSVHELISGELAPAYDKYAWAVLMLDQEFRTRREERFMAVSAEMREHDTSASFLDSQSDEKSLSANLRLGPFYLH